MKTLKLIKPIAILGLMSFMVLLTPLTSQALTVEEVTNPRKDNGGWVTDMAGILSNQTEIELNRIITTLEQSNGTEIAVVTVPETTPANSPKAFATQLFNYWGIGKAEENNGILFLISAQDRRVEIEIGYGIEAILPNAEVNKIIDTKITPRYKKGNFDRGTLDGTEALIAALDDSSANLNHSWTIIILLTGIASISLAGIILWQRKRQRKVFVNPQATITKLNRRDSREIHCAKCRQPMEKVTNIKLSQPQKVAQQLGSISFRGYKCPSCHQAQESYSLIAYHSNSSRYRICPQCDEITATRTETTLKKATRKSKGKILISDRCHCCDYCQEKTIDTPRLRPSANRGGGSSSGRSSSSYYIGGSCGGGASGGGRSGGDFGGGASGGNGAGGSW